MQLKNRLTVQFTAVVAPILMVSFFIIYYSSSTYRRQEFYSRLQKKAETTAEFLIKVDEVDSSLLKIIDKTQKDQLPFQRITVYNYKNQAIYSNDDSISFEVSTAFLKRIRLENKCQHKEGKYEVMGITYNGKYNRFVVVAGAIDLFGLSKLRNLRNTLLILFMLIIGIVALAGRIYSVRALEPIKAVIREANKISPQNLSSRLNKSKSEDEIGALINTFNKLLDRIEDAFKIQKLFVASASHELKNPLTVMTSQLEVSLLNERDKEEYKSIIKSVLEDMKGLNQLTLQLMELARVSYEITEIPFEFLRIDEVVWSSKEFIQTKYPDYQFKFNIASLPEEEDFLYIHGNETLLKTAFVNIAENACKFSKNKTVSVTLSLEPNRIIIEFRDNGPGIGEEESKLIFEPFYRAHKNSQVKGHGIGLALVYQIVNLHKAKIEIVSLPGEGTIMRLVFDK